MRTLPPWEHGEDECELPEMIPHVRQGADFEVWYRDTAILGPRAVLVEAAALAQISHVDADHILWLEL